MSEIWKDIEGYDGYYQVSNKGRVRSWKNTGGELSFKNKPKILKQSDNKGYRKVKLSHNGEKKNKKVHRLVAKTFLPNPKKKRTVNHKNGIKDDNSVMNLEWATYSENMQHAFNSEIGLRVGKKGFENGNSKLNREQVLQIRSICEQKLFSQKEVADAYGVCGTLISMIVLRKCWKHI